MERKDLINIIDEVLVPLSFKRKGNFWVKNGTELNKIVDIQKSQYSNSFYINFGFNISELPLGRVKVHIGSRLNDIHRERTQKLSTLLDFENSISDEERSEKLLEVLTSDLVSEIENINTPTDLLAAIRAKKFLAISAPVVSYFGDKLDQGNTI